MTLKGRLTRLERAAGYGVAPEACLVHEAGMTTAYLTATGEAMPAAEYDRRWPGHPTLKVYLDRRMLNALEADWSDAPPPCSSANQ